MAGTTEDKPGLMKPFGTRLAGIPRRIWEFAKENPKTAIVPGLAFLAFVAAIAAFPPLLALLPAIPTVGPAIVSFIGLCGAGAPVVFGLMAAAIVGAISAGLVHFGQWLHGRKGPGAGGKASNNAKTTGDVDPDNLDGGSIKRSNAFKEKAPQATASIGSAVALSGLGGLDPHAAQKPGTPPPHASTNAAPTGETPTGAAPTGETPAGETPTVEATTKAEPEATEIAGFEI